MNSSIVIDRAKRLLEWNSVFLVHGSSLTEQAIAELFAAQFCVIANGRSYEADYSTYLAFLNTFRANIKTIDYQVDRFIVDEFKNSVVLVMSAWIHRLDGSCDHFDAMLLLEFDIHGKIVLWQELYVQLN